MPNETPASNVPVLFFLRREEDETGVSGVGHVADGVVFPNGKAVLCWLGELSSVGVYSSLADLEKIHGHNGKTKVVFGHEAKLANSGVVVEREKLRRCVALALNAAAIPTADVEILNEFRAPLEGQKP